MIQQIINIAFNLQIRSVIDCLQDLLPSAQIIVEYWIDRFALDIIRNRVDYVRFFAFFVIC